MKKSRTKIAATALLLAAVILVIPAVYGVQPDNAGTLYSAYLDWLQGKPVGLAKINIQTPEKLSGAKIVVIDMTSQKPRQLYSGDLYTPTVKIERKPMGTYLETKVENGRVESVEKVRFMPVTLLIIVANENYWGVKTITFEPNKPMTTLNLKVPLHKGKARRGGIHVESIRTEDHGEITINGIKTAIIRSLPGTTVSWVVGRDDAIAYESFSQDWVDKPDPTMWQDSGSTLVKDKEISCAISASDGEVRLVTSNVAYRVTETEICTWLWCRDIWTLVPIRIENFHVTSIGHYSGEIPAGMPVRYRDRSENINSFDILFDGSSDNGGVYFTTTISTQVCGGAGVQVCFTGNVDTYRESATGYRPHYHVTINNWGHHTRLYYAYKDGNGRNYYEIYLKWGPADDSMPQPLTASDKE
ncbi:hypothetical protein [Thermococcus gammatolerans]|uniref:Uncharacterized protein n=1 Tax=Thermococcus gammatolerans (strain DSM 15229 / JCM 11827 / EJ3) TaxID=593117 RepID=C5A2G1_THEGJ|nr:hypothetical protein [Thermococcus gammatolerans]ACS34580.1 Conserved hypothetical protein [Thermococcus gammatolerans EJ3]